MDSDAFSSTEGGPSGFIKSGDLKMGEAFEEVGSKSVGHNLFNNFDAHGGSSTDNHPFGSLEILGI